MTAPSGSTSIDRGPSRTETGGGEPEPRGGTQRAWVAIGLIMLGAIGLVAAFSLAVHNNTGTVVASPAATNQPAAVAPVAPATGPVTVSLSEFKVGMPATIAAGQVTLNIRNDGKVAHELLVFKSPLAVSQYPKVTAPSTRRGRASPRTATATTSIPARRRPAPSTCRCRAPMFSCATCPGTSPPACTRRWS